MLTLDTIDAPKRALLLENIHPDAIARLTKAGYQVETRAGALGEDELIAALPGISSSSLSAPARVSTWYPALVSRAMASGWMFSSSSARFGASIVSSVSTP